VPDRVVIFGTGSFGELARFYFEHDSALRPVAFTANADHISADSFHGLPLIPFEGLDDSHPPDSFALFVAVGYSGVNRVRASIFEEAKRRGYELPTYVSSRATTWPGLEIGDNCFVFEDNTLQPFARVGNDVVLWSGNHVGHHSSIGDHCFVTSHVVISGHVRVGAYSFLGVNATLRDSISIGERCVVGAGATIMRSTAPNEVYPGPRAAASEKSSDDVGM
jgi:sugar O-acyltransferase (sialic acid O-acetyltransferase NeuD family)